MDLGLSGKGLKVKVFQSCLTLGDPMDYTVQGILPARIPEWVAFPFSMEIFPTQGENPGFLCCRQTQLSEPQGKLVSESCLVVSDSLRPYGLYSPWNSPSQDTGVDSHSLLSGIFPTQGLNPGLPYCRQILYQLSHKGSPKILEWVAFPFSRGSSQPRD